MSFLSAANMWRPVERDSRLFKDCAGVPRHKPWKWPLIDVFICHYNEDTDQTIATLRVSYQLYRAGFVVFAWSFALCFRSDHLVPTALRHSCVCCYVGCLSCAYVLLCNPCSILCTESPLLMPLFPDLLLSRLQKAMAMDWPKDRMHIYILDDGYFKKPTVQPYHACVDSDDPHLTDLQRDQLRWWDDPYVRGSLWRGCSWSVLLLTIETVDPGLLGWMSTQYRDSVA